MSLFHEPFTGVDQRMQCPECQADCLPDAVFCQQCGYRLQPEEEPAEGAAPAQAERPKPADPFHGRTGAAPDEDDQEDEIWKGSFSKKGMIGQWILAGVGTIVALIVAAMTSTWLPILGGIVLVWALLIAWYGYKRLSVHYTLTTQRLIHESGILWRTIDRIELIDIDDVTFKQGPVERVFKVGTIVVISGDKTSPELKLPGIDQVRKVADEIDDARRKERRRRGLHMITQGA